MQTQFPPVQPSHTHFSYKTQVNTRWCFVLNVSDKNMALGKTTSLIIIDIKIATKQLSHFQDT